MTKTQNICLICTLHQPSIEVISETDYCYVLSRGGHMAYWGSTLKLSESMSMFGIDSSEGKVPIDILVVLSANGMNDRRIKSMSDRVNEDIKRSIESESNQLADKMLDKRRKKFCFSDIGILLSRELTEVYRYKYKIYLLYLFLLILICLYLGYLHGFDIGKSVDCFSLISNTTCDKYMDSMNNVQNQFSFLAFITYFISFLQLFILRIKLKNINNIIHGCRNS